LKIDALTGEEGHFLPRVLRICAESLNF